jgi:hypothetical protein
VVETEVDENELVESMKGSEDLLATDEGDVFSRDRSVRVNDCETAAAGI